MTGVSTVVMRVNLPRQKCRASLKQEIHPLRRLAEIGIFPGRNAEASLKRGCGTRPVRRGLIFPVRNAGASLKPHGLVRAADRGELIFPGQKCRGLIEATRPKRPRGRQSAIFPGRNAGASLKRAMGQDAPFFPAQSSPSEIRGPH